MIKIENTEVNGFKAAMRGCRNPMNSHDKSDSRYSCLCMDDKRDCPAEPYIVGPNDLALMKKLSKAGTDHAKFLRFITVTADITAPLYWWKEADQYKVGTVTNSTSTMHRIHAKEFTMDDFSHEHLGLLSTELLEMIIQTLNNNRDLFLNTNDKQYWWQLIQILPSSYNQKRTILLNYQVLKNMYHARKNHKLDCWHDFCRWCEALPYFKEVCIDD